MEFIRFTLAAVALSALAACGGGDTEDRLDIADPKVRFVDVSQISPNVTLFREEVAQSDASNVGYTYASRYFDVSPGTATWSIRPAAATTTKLAELSFDAKRGDRNTIVALPGSAGLDALLIDDPYNKSLTSNNTRVRVVNAAINADSVDVYLTPPATDINSRGPDFSAVQFKQSMPGTGADSVQFSSGSYQLRMTAAGSKTVIFNATVSVPNNADWLLVAIPTSLAGTLVPNDVKLLLVQGNDTDNGTTSEITNTP